MKMRAPSLGDPSEQRNRLPRPRCSLRDSLELGRPGRCRIALIQQSLNLAIDVAVAGRDLLLQGQHPKTVVATGSEEGWESPDKPGCESHWLYCAFLTNEYRPPF